MIMILLLMILHLHQIIPEGSEKIFLTYIIKIMTTNDQIRDEKLQYNVNREAAKICTLSSGEYLTGEKILPSNQQQIIEQSKFTYSPWEKLLKNK